MMLRRLPCPTADINKTKGPIVRRRAVIGRDTDKRNAVLLLLCQNNNDRMPLASCFLAFIVAHNLHTAIHRSMLGNSTITRNNDTNAYIMATMNNISAALDSRSMSVGRFICLVSSGAVWCGASMVYIIMPTMTHFGGSRRKGVSPRLEHDQEQLVGVGVGNGLV